MSDLDSATETSAPAPSAEPSPPVRRRVRRAMAAAVALAVLAGGGAVLALVDTGDTGSAATSPRAARPVDEDEAQRRARASDRKVEVATLTDEFSTTYANPDGTFTYQVSADPVRARTAGGGWAPVDLDLERDGDGNWHSANSPYPVTFSGGGDGSGADRAGARASGGSVRPAVFRAGAADAVPAADDTWSPLLTMTAEGHEVAFAWPGALPEPVVEDNRALYEGVLQNVDLMLSARTTGFTHVLVVHSAEAAAALAADPPRYRVTSPTLSFTLDPGTDVLTAKDDAGQEIVVSPTPFLWDSAGTHDTDETSADPDAAAGTNENPEVVEEGPARPSEEPPVEGRGDADRDENAVENDPGEPGDAGDSGDSGDSGSGDSGGVEGGADPVAFAPGNALGLPAANGPGEGAHASTAGAAFAGDVLTISPPKGYLTETEGLTYPLFLDPSTVGTRSNWTTVYKKYPGSSFYDGANYNEDTKEARVGFERQTWGTARSFFKLKLKKSIKGADVSSAVMSVLETHSWSCSKRTVQLWRTDSFNSKTTWNRQPSWKRKVTSKSFAYGWKSNSSCPDTNVKFTTTTLAQEAADNGWMDVNIGLVASTSSSAPTGSASGLETDTYSWKKFKAESTGSPSMDITYNRKPNTPTSVTMSPGTCDTSTSPYIKVGKSETLAISAKGTDPDGELSKLEFELWETGKQSTTTRTLSKSVRDGETGAVAIKSYLANGKTYSWRVRGKDASTSGAWAPTGGDGVCRFTYDTALPDSPAPVISTDFPSDKDDGIDGNEEDSVPDVWSKKPFGNAGSFTFEPGSPNASAPANTDIVKFVYSINSTTYAGWVCANGAQGTTGGLTRSCSTPVKTATVTNVQPPAAGPNTLYVKAVDAAGNISPSPTKHVFNVTPRSKADGPGDLNGDGNADLAHVTAAGNLWIGAVSQNGTYLVNTFGTREKGALIKDGATAPHLWDGNGTYSLVTHNGDFAPGDGVTDWVVRTPEGRLFVYPGDGYGSIDVSKRVEVRLPANAPDPSTFSEIKAAGDITGDGQPELFVAGGVGGAELWVLSGYSGGAFGEAVQMTTTSWAHADRDFVAIADYNGDGAADLTYRTAGGNIILRKGILDSSGTGTVLKSLGQSGWSLDGDSVYASSSFTRAAFPQVYGTPDATGDGIPDMWATNAAGALLLYKGGAATLGSPITVRSSGYGTTVVKQLG
ncbi:FG-GAP-like repeat-containing protein [Streptomyces sp. NPDC087212]|uniref:FG-GAP-like repeat-containing protein n=1 Tax=Streptomyces sp. NPDC087212 TaxID=3365766 RepID=UPI0038088E33